MAKRTRSAGTATTLTLPLCAFEQARAEWRKTLKAGLGDQANPVNRSGVEIKPIYTPQDLTRARLSGRSGLSRASSP